MAESKFVQIAVAHASESFARASTHSMRPAGSGSTTSIIGGGTRWRRSGSPCSRADARVKQGAEAGGNSAGAEFWRRLGARGPAPPAVPYCRDVPGLTAGPVARPVGLTSRFPGPNPTGKVHRHRSTSREKRQRGEWRCKVGP